MAFICNIALAIQNVNRIIFNISLPYFINLLDSKLLRAEHVYLWCVC